MNLKQALSVALTTAGGALLTYLSKALADGALPSSDAAWRTLGTGALVAVVASLIHLYQPAPGTAEGGGTVPGSRGFVRLDLAIFVASIGALILSASAFVTACASVPAIATTAVPIIDNAICQLASEQTNEPTWETFVCSVIDPATRTAAMVTVQVPKAQAAAFAKAHVQPLTLDAGK